MSPRSATLLLFGLVLAGCATPPRSERYRLPDSEPIGAASTGIGIGQIYLADYLARSGIALELDNHELHLAIHHVWDEPLDSGIRRVLTQALNLAKSAEPERIIDLDIATFHGSQSGTLRFTGSWTERPRGSSDASAPCPFAFEVDLAESGYLGLAIAHAEAVKRLAKELVP